MKKYVKPDFYFENFQLSNYAAGCGITPVSSNFNTALTCVFNLVDGITVFNAQEICEKNTVTPDVYCYQNGSGMTVAWS